jgi:signal transduction protein with GAF and PtsI domain
MAKSKKTEISEGRDRDFKTLAEAHGRLSRKLSLIQGMANLFLNPDETERNIEAAMTCVMRAVDAQAGSIILIDRNRNDLFFAAARGPKESEIKKFRLAVGQGIGGASAMDRETIAVSDVRRDPRFSREMDEALGFETRSVLAVPIVFRNTALGSVEVINKSGSDVFTTEEVSLVEEIARLLGALLTIGERLKTDRGTRYSSQGTRF